MSIASMASYCEDCKHSYWAYVNKPEHHYEEQICGDAWVMKDRSLKDRVVTGRTTRPAWCPGREKT